MFLDLMDALLFSIQEQGVD